MHTSMHIDRETFPGITDFQNLQNTFMLGFLSKDSRNAQAVVSLKRKAGAVALTSKAKKSIARKVAEPIPPVVIERKFLDIPITASEAKEIVNVFRGEEFFTGFKCTYSMEEDGPVLITCAVLAVMEQLKVCPEKYQNKKSSSRVALPSRSFLGSKGQTYYNFLFPASQTAMPSSPPTYSGFQNHHPNLFE